GTWPEEGNQGPVHTPLPLVWLRTGAKRQAGLTCSRFNSCVRAPSAQEVQGHYLPARAAVVDGSFPPVARQPPVHIPCFTRPPGLCASCTCGNCCLRLRSNHWRGGF